MIKDISSVVKLGKAVTQNNTDGEGTAKVQEGIDGLFSGKYFNTGSDKTDIKTIEQQVLTLETQIDSKEQEISEEKDRIDADSNTIKAHQEQLKEALLSIISENERLTQEQSKKLAETQDFVLEDLKAGRIKEEQVPSTLAARIAGLGFVKMTQKDLEYKLANSNDYQTKINNLVNSINNSTEVVTKLQTQVNTSKITLGALNTILENTKTAKRPSKSFSDSRPIYSAEKSDFISELSTKYGKTAAGVSGDIWSTSSPQTANFAKAMSNGVLGQMYQKGFTYKEAAYAISWMFTGIGVSYNPSTNKLTVPHGHGAAAVNAYSTFLSQLNGYWGNNAAGLSVITATEDDANLAHDFGEESTAEELGQETPPAAAERTDPIGFNNGNMSYDFVIDSNHDNIFNGKEEFLGAVAINLSKVKDSDIKKIFGEKFADLTVADLKKFDSDGDGKISGIEELFMYDIDANGVIEKDELEDLMILKTNQKTGAQSFTSATLAGVDKIDLKQFQTNGKYDGSKINRLNSLDINNNLTQNKFNVKMADGKTLGGYQRLDDNEFLDKMYGNAFGMKYTIAFKPVLDENGNVINAAPAADTEALDSARTALIDTQDALKTAQNNFKKEQKTQDDDAQRAINEGEADILEEAEGTLVLNKIQKLADSAAASNSMSSVKIEDIIAEARRTIPREYQYLLDEVEIKFGKTSEVKNGEVKAEYMNDTNTVILSDTLKDKSKQEIVSYLLHELVHAKDNDGDTSIQEEIDAWTAQIEYWQNNANGADNESLDTKAEQLKSAPSTFAQNITDLYKKVFPNIAQTSANHGA